MITKSRKRLFWIIAAVVLAGTAIITLSPALKQAFRRAVLLREISECQEIYKAYLQYLNDATVRDKTMLETKPPTVQELIDGGYLSKSDIKDLDMPKLVIHPCLPNDPDEIPFIELTTPHGRFIVKKGGDADFYKN
jgi:hypothetical protein